jgi:hypothetical protein
MLPLLLFLNLISMGVTAPVGTTIDDPLADFLVNPPELRRDRAPDHIDFVYTIHIDFQNAGNPYVLLTTEYLHADRGVYSWLVFKPTGDGYRLLDYALMFPLEIATVVSVPGCPGQALATIGDISPTGCVIHAMWLDANDREERTNVNKTGSVEEINAFLQECRENQKRYIEEIDTSKMPQRVKSANADETAKRETESHTAPTSKTESQQAASVEPPAEPSPEPSSNTAPIPPVPKPFVVPAPTAPATTPTLPPQPTPANPPPAYTSRIGFLYTVGIPAAVSAAFATILLLLIRRGTRR